MKKASGRCLKNCFLTFGRLSDPEVSGMMKNDKKLNAFNPPVIFLILINTQRSCRPFEVCRSVATDTCFLKTYTYFPQRKTRVYTVHFYTYKHGFFNYNQSVPLTIMYKNMKPVFGGGMLQIAARYQSSLTVPCNLQEGFKTV